MRESSMIDLAKRLGQRPWNLSGTSSVSGTSDSIRSDYSRIESDAIN
jgi:hypothetical protein